MQMRQAGIACARTSVCAMIRQESVRDISHQAPVRILAARSYGRYYRPQYVNDQAHRAILLTPPGSGVTNTMQESSGAQRSSVDMANWAARRRDRSQGRRSRDMAWLHTQDGIRRRGGGRPRQTEPYRDDLYNRGLNR